MFIRTNKSHKKAPTPKQVEKKVEIEVVEEIKPIRTYKVVSLPAIVEEEPIVFEQDETMENILEEE